MELVNLFKELMKRGWKVYWEYDKLMSHWQTRWKRDFWFWELWEIKYSLRELVSKESGLWQFVCENWIIENWKTVHDYVISHITYSYDKGCWWYAPNNSEFWIMMSALCDEDKLEKFLLENIKIDGE